jgi:pSer/pThr/pTyr-binding forkhead associated (FHA) protein
MNSSENRQATTGRPGDKAAEPGANLVLVAKLVDGITRKEYDIDHSPFTFGRSLTNDVSYRSPSMSRMHGQILRKEDGFYLEDLGSTNGTYVGPKRAKRPTLLKDGDVIHVKAMPGQVRGDWSATFRLWFRAVADARKPGNE